MASKGKIQSLNQSIRQSIPSMARVARRNPEVELVIRVISFGDEAKWHIESHSSIEEFEWKDLVAGGLTSMGAALELVANELSPSVMGVRALTPIILLVSDGQPTDNFKKGLDRLMEQPLGQKAIKLAIAIGSDADRQVLQKFTGEEIHSNLHSLSEKIDIETSGLVFSAANATALASFIEWASTVVVSTVSLPVTRLNSESDQEIQEAIVDDTGTLFADQNESDSVIW